MNVRLINEKNQGGASGELEILDEETEAEIGRKLRESYADVLEAPVPQRFHDLIRSLVEEQSDDE